MAIKITRKTRNIEKLIKKLEKIGKSNVSSGYFPEQGYHSEYGMSYANLMSIHETGKFGLPVRPVKFLTAQHMDRSYPEWSIAIKKFLQGKQDLDSSLHEIGIEATAEAKSIFGSVPPLQPNSPETIQIKGSNQPLVDSGELRDNWGYKVGDGGAVVTNVSYG